MQFNLFEHRTSNSLFCQPLRNLLFHLHRSLMYQHFSWKIRRCFHHLNCAHHVYAWVSYQPVCRLFIDGHVTQYFLTNSSNLVHIIILRFSSNLRMHVCESSQTYESWSLPTNPWYSSTSTCQQWWRLTQCFSVAFFSHLLLESKGHLEILEERQILRIQILSKSVPEQEAWRCAAVLTAFKQPLCAFLFQRSWVL